jgi:hypothetical protein
VHRKIFKSLSWTPIVTETCTLERPVVVTPQDLKSTPPSPRSLRSVKGARLELCRLYAQTKAGEVEPAVAGRLAHILGLLIGSYRDHEFEQRLDRLEAALAGQGGAQLRRPNGGYTTGVRP